MFFFYDPRWRGVNKGGGKRLPRKYNAVTKGQNGQ